MLAYHGSSRTISTSSLKLMYMTLNGKTKVHGIIQPFAKKSNDQSFEDYFRSEKRTGMN